MALRVLHVVYKSFLPTTPPQAKYYDYACLRDQTQQVQDLISCGPSHSSPSSVLAPSLAECSTHGLMRALEPHYLHMCVNDYDRENYDRTGRSQMPIT